MQLAFLVGRVIFSLFFLQSSFNHFKNAGMLAGYAASKGVPAPKLAILGSGVLLLIGGLSILLGFRPVIGIAALILFLVPVSMSPIVKPVTPIGTSFPSVGVAPRCRLASIFVSPSGATGVSFAICARAEAR